MPQKLECVLCECRCIVQKYLVLLLCIQVVVLRFYHTIERPVVLLTLQIVKEFGIN